VHSFNAFVLLQRIPSHSLQHSQYCTMTSWLVKSGDRDFDVCSVRGATEFLQYVSPRLDGRPNAKTFIGNNLNNAQVGRDVLSMFGNTNELPQEARAIAVKGAIEQCLPPYRLIAAVASCADRQAFAEIPLKQHDLLVKHACNVFKDLSNNPRWTATGVLEAHDATLLTALMSCAQHWGFTPASLHGNLLETLAVFSQSCARTMPSAEVAPQLRNLVFNTRSITVLQNKSPIDDIYKKLEDTGILAQFIRLATLPQDSQSNQATFMILDEIAECPSLVKRKFRRGSPTGDVLDAVINRRDGYQGARNPGITQRLVALQKMATMAQPIESEAVFECCTYCQRIPDGEEVKLLTCSRCKGKVLFSRLFLGSSATSQTLKPFDFLLQLLVTAPRNVSGPIGRHINLCATLQKPLARAAAAPKTSKQWWKISFWWRRIITRL